MVGVILFLVCGMIDLVITSMPAPTAEESNTVG